MASSSTLSSSEPSSVVMNGSRGTQQKGSSERSKAENQQLGAPGRDTGRESVHDIVKKWLPVFKKKANSKKNPARRNARNGEIRNQKKPSKRNNSRPRPPPNADEKRKAPDNEREGGQELSEGSHTSGKKNGKTDRSQRELVESKKRTSTNPEEEAVAVSISVSDRGSTRFKFSRSHADGTVDTQEFLGEQSTPKESASEPQGEMMENSSPKFVLWKTTAQGTNSSSLLASTAETATIKAVTTGNMQETDTPPSDGRIDSEEAEMVASSDDIQALDTLLTLAEATEYCAPSIESPSEEKEDKNKKNSRDSTAEEEGVSSSGQCTVEADTAVIPWQKPDSGASSSSRIPHEVVAKCMAAQNISKADSMPVEVIPGIYIGSVAAAVNFRTFEENNISHVVCAASGIAPIFKSKGIQYLLLELEDDPDADILKYLEVAAQFISKALDEEGNVLVHCFAGRSRSAAIIAAYLIRYHQMSPDEAIQTIKSKKENVKPNSGFYYQLEKFADGSFD